MAITYKSTHIAEALNNLLEQYKNSPILKGLISVFVKQIQELETAFFDVYSITLDNAFGATLDGYGSLVDEPRLGRDDDTYRLAIKAKIHINVSSGTPEDIYTAMVAFDSRQYKITQYQKAAFFCKAIDAITTIDPVDYWLLLHNIKIAGVKAYFHYNLVDDDNVFTLASGDTVETDSLLGLADDGQTTGGFNSEIIDGSAYFAGELPFTYFITKLGEFLERVSDGALFIKKE